jgi:hypothetical protein
MTLGQTIVSCTFLILTFQGQAQNRSDTSVNKKRTEQVTVTSAGIYKQQTFTRRQKHDLKSLQGNWTHDKDSLATINISGQVWTFNYAHNSPSKNDDYEIVLKDSLFGTDKVKSRILLLFNSSDRLEYEVLGLNDSILSLMHLPTGRLHLYNKLTKTGK